MVYAGGKWSSSDGMITDIESSDGSQLALVFTGHDPGVVWQATSWKEGSRRSGNRHDVGAMGGARRRFTLIVETPVVTASVS